MPHPQVYISSLTFSFSSSSIFKPSPPLSTSGSTPPITCLQKYPIFVSLSHSSACPHCHITTSEKKYSHPRDLILSLRIDTLHSLQILPHLALLTRWQPLILLSSRLFLNLTLPICTLVAVILFPPPCEALCVRLIEGCEDRLDASEDVICVDVRVSTLSGADLGEEDVSAGAGHLHFENRWAAGYRL